MVLLPLFTSLKLPRHTQSDAVKQRRFLIVLQRIRRRAQGNEARQKKYFLLDIFPYGNILPSMARAATTSDVFNAIAEPRRREIVDYLAAGDERDVTELVVKLGLPQPAVSKHLGVLRKVGVVAVHKAGQRRLYRLNPQELKPVHDWIQNFERFWTDQLASIKEVAEQKAKQRAAHDRAASNTSTPFKGATSWSLKRSSPPSKPCTSSKRC